MRLSSSQIEYTSRINTVIQHINTHLGEDLPLDQLASVACFSQYHFHRLFSSIMNETPADFVLRLRLEKAANLLTYNSHRSITDITFSSGFSSPSIFSRSFKKHFGVSATQWSKKSKANSKKRKEISFHGSYLSTEVRNKSWSKKKRMNVEIKTLPALHVAYVANLQGYNSKKIKDAWGTLCRWASANDLLNDTSMTLGISFDNPAITPENKCRYYACIVVPPDTKGNTEIAFLEISGGKHAIFHFKGKRNAISDAYTQFYGEWLPSSGYQPAEQPCYEIYRKFPEQRPRGVLVMDICMPIKPL